MKTLTKLVNDVKHETTARTYKVEKKAYAANLIIRNVEKRNEIETENQTAELVQNIFRVMGVPDGQFKITEAKRFKTSNNVQGKPPLIMIKLAAPSEKAAIFQKIKNLKNTNYSNISIGNEHPPSIRKAVAAKETEAYDLRHAVAGTKTKITITPDGIPELWAKGPGQEEFVKINKKGKTDNKKPESKKPENAASANEGD